MLGIIVVSDGHSLCIIDNFCWSFLVFITKKKRTEKEILATEREHIVQSVGITLTDAIVKLYLMKNIKKNLNDRIQQQPRKERDSCGSLLI